MSDLELLVASDRDPTAFREIYERYAGLINAYLLRRVREREAALDLTAETFAQAWQSRARCEDHHNGSLGPWLFGIARNVLLSSVRKRRLISDACERLKVTAGRSQAEPSTAWLDGLDEDLADALATLPHGQRRAVELRVLGDHSYDQVAHELDCSQGAARIKVSRGLATLRTRLTTSLAGDALSSSPTSSRRSQP
jgi:RNA polymerase sigma factor (sigma-70 family)